MVYENSMIHFLGDLIFIKGEGEGDIKLKHIKNRDSINGESDTEGF